jgi:uncharacterized protein
VTVGVVIAVLVLHNLLTNLWFTDRWTYVPANLAVAGGLVALAGVEVPAGAWWPAVAAALVVLATVALAAAVAPQLLADQRMAGVSAGGTAWRALVRIPFGTVAVEEVAFRAVLPALVSPAGAAALFGLWHVLPTAKTLDVNGVQRHRTVAVREATGGLAAPALAHAAANSGATVAAFIVLRRA